MHRADGVTLQFDAFHLPPGVDLLHRGEEVVSLEPRAVRVLRYLVQHHDRVLSKEELLEEVWSDVFTTDGVLKKAVSQIRRVLGDDAEQSRFIATYHGRGYRFIAPVTRSHVRRAPKPSTAPNEWIPNYDQIGGRDAELLTLRAELRSALEGHPRPVVIVGEPGIGKTQLVRHFRRAAIEQGAIALNARFFDYRAAGLAPYELFIDLLRTALGSDLGNDRDAPLRDVIEERCGIRLPPELFADAQGHGSVSAGSVGDHFRFVVPICRCFLALSRRQPVVVVFDDLQWADSASLDVIGCLMRTLESEPLMPIMVVRSDDAENADHPVRAWLEEHATRRAYTTMGLERLDEIDCREVIGAIFGTRRSGEIPRSDVEKLFRLTDGNPYFLVETLRLLVSAGAIVPEPSKRRWAWKGLRDLSLPQTIVTAARAKIDRLPERVRAIVDQAAIIGDEFHVSTLCALTGRTETEIEQILSEAVRLGVLSIQGLTPGEDCRFQHSILRHVVYDAIAPHRRRALHARAAEAVEAVYRDDRERVAEALASHYAAAGDARRAFESWMCAWRTATRRSEWRKAASLIERADETSRALTLTDAEQIELRLALGETWNAVGRFREAAQMIERAVSLAASAGDQLSIARAMFLRGVTEISLSSYMDARASLSQALDLFLHSENASGISRTIVQLAVVEAAIGNYERASALVAQLRAGETDDDIAALADGILGWSLALRGQYAEGAALLEKALEHHDAVGDLRERALHLRRLHWVYLCRGEHERAIELAVRARSDSATVGDANGEAKANMGIGQARLAQGRHDEGVSYLTRAIEQLKVIGDAHCEAECLWQLGRAREEIPLLDRALTMVREIGDRDDEFRILIDRARLQIMRGDLDDARDSALSAKRIADSLSNRDGSARAAAELAQIETMECGGSASAF